MLADLFLALRRGVDQLTYWCHTYLPFNRWRRITEEVASAAREEVARYGIEVPLVDRRRAYQVARMIVANRHGEHLVDLVPDAYGVYAPTCCATTQSGKKKFAPLAERREAFRRHPQTLVYLLTPSWMARMGLGSSPPGTLLGIPTAEPTPPPGVIASRLREQIGSDAGGSTVDEYAKMVAQLHAAPAEEEEPAEAA